MTTLETVTLATAIIGAACGICGTVLGVVNTWSQVSRNRVRLRVVPKMAFMVGGRIVAGTKATNQLRELVSSQTPSRWCIEVVNLSTFAVTISEVGFAKSNGLRHVLVPAEVSNGRSWPARLEPREAVMLYAQIGETPAPQVMRRPYAYAETDCGVLRFGTSPIFKDYFAAITSMEGRRD